MSNPPTFIDACFAGKALLEDIDDWVDAWHEADGAPKGVDISLATYLGMTDLEYSLWVERPSSLRVIVASRHQKRPISDVESAQEFALAARAKDDREAINLVSWLERTGRISADELPKSG